MIVRLYAISYLPAYILSMVFFLVLVLVSPGSLEASDDNAKFDLYSALFGFIVIGILNPLIETLVLVILAKLALMFKLRKLIVIFFITLFFFFLHAFFDVYWGLVQAWPFMVQSYTYVYRAEWKSAIYIFSAHSINNMLFCSLIFLQ